MSPPLLQQIAAQATSQAPRAVATLGAAPGSGDEVMRACYDPRVSVLVIGATGFIGPRLIRRLLARGESVVGVDLNPAAPGLGGEPIGVPVVRGDVTRFDDVMRTVLDVKPERLINLAYGLGAGEGNPHQVMRLDILGMDNCFEAARLGGVTRV